MKKLFYLTAITAFMSLGGLAQNCKYKVNEIDKFTGKFTKETKPYTVIETFFTNGDFSIRKVDTSVVFVLNYLISAYSKFDVLSISKGEQLIFLFDDGKTVSLNCADDIKGEKKFMVGVPPVYSCLLSNAVYPVTKSQMEQFFKSEIKSIRFYRTSANGKSEPVDNDIKKKNKGDIQELIKCVM